MRAVVLRVIGALAGAVVLGGAIYMLREATMSTHYDTGPDSRMVLEVRAASNRAERGVTLEQMAEAQIEVCVLEVSRVSPDDLSRAPGSDDRFVLTLAPALDSTDRKQLRGCLEDWSVPHLQLDVEAMTDIQDDGSSDAASGDRPGGA